MQTSSKRRHGFSPRPELRRTCVIKLRLRPEEKQSLADKAKARKCPLATLIRDTVLYGHAPVIPEINKQEWQELGRAKANLNQIAYHLNCGGDPEIVEVFQLIAELRSALIGLSRNEDASENCTGAGHEGHE